MTPNQVSKTSVIHLFVWDNGKWSLCGKATWSRAYTSSVKREIRYGFDDERGDVGVSCELCAKAWRSRRGK